MRYELDNLLARGTWGAILWLVAVTFAVVLISSVLLAAFGVSFTGDEDSSLLEDFWQSMLRTMDPGTMAGDVGWGRRVLALLITMFGLLVVAALIGIVASGVEERIDQMRRGRSVVMETGHLVVLGESDRLPVVIEQLVLANAGRGKNVIVVLADRDPAELNRAVRDVVRERHGSRIVFRSGDPASRSDLALARLQEARAVIVVAEGGDARSVRIVLAVGAELGGFGTVPIVVELRDPATREMLSRACGSSVHAIITTEVVARTAAFALRQPALSTVVAELIAFGGCDLHVCARPELVGSPFGEVVHRFANARPIGRMRPGGEVELNPAPTAVFEAGDQLIVVAHDIDALERAGPSDLEWTHSSDVVTVSLHAEPTVEHLLVIGWNRLGGQLLDHWAAFAAPTSTVEIVFDAQLHAASEIVVPNLTDDRLTLTAVGPGERHDTAIDEPVTTVVLLGYSERLDDEAADARTLLELAVLRRTLAGRPGAAPRVIVELLDVGNAFLAQLPGLDDSVISQAIGSQIIAALAERPANRAVLLKLYDSESASLHLVPAHALGVSGERRADEIFAASFRAGVLAIGWRRSTPHGVELVLNPHVDDRVELGGDDCVVLIG